MEALAKATGELLGSVDVAELAAYTAGVAGMGQQRRQTARWAGQRQLAAHWPLSPTRCVAALANARHDCCRFGRAVSAPIMAKTRGSPETAGFPAMTT